ncbi:MAG: 2-furoyl-CoA dehydrogenase binding subunit [Bradyrhizobium sp.]|jgi:carbon-monoxide dehydrogenase medium subunit/2-furoyl-CoA dehydrogenase FAD binding subunit|nr:2-furoyl-CoA dehydrogenase binding subunit [Bradyrhizobium sp.]
MKPAAFEYFRPDTIEGAIELLGRYGEDARVIAGGQSLVPAMNLRMATPRVLVDINRIPELKFTQKAGNTLRIGAATTQAALIRTPDLPALLPLLAAALPHIGHVQTRSRGTIGGSLVHADPSAEIGLVAATLNAEFIIRGQRGERCVRASEFQIGALTTDVSADELLVGVEFPIAGANARFSFKELARRQGDFALVAVAAQVDGDDFWLAVGGLEEVPLRCDQLVAELRAHDFQSEAIAEAIRIQLQSASPLADIHASGDYRMHLAAVLLEDCLKEILH